MNKVYIVMWLKENKEAYNHGVERVFYKEVDAEKYINKRKSNTVSFYILEMEVD